MPEKMLTRSDQLYEVLKNEPAFRMKQITKAFYQPQIRSWDQITTLPAKLQETLNEIPFLSVTEKTVQSNKRKDTYKAALVLSDQQAIETVLMKNPRGYWTICVSSQVGCAMRCDFCATGKMGFTRNLSKDEIVDQYRFWMLYLADHPELEQRISNIVFMGMGEPLANYDQVKATIIEWLEQTEMGPTKITVSTVGHLATLDKILGDREWPHVRLAISLHSADRNTRKAIVPTSHDAFLQKLKHWAHAYLEQFGNNKHHLTFEYVMLDGVNDTDAHAIQLANYVNSIGKVKVNLIPYNFTDSDYKKSKRNQIERFKTALEAKGITVTQRRTMGDDIDAACGQLIQLGKK